MRLVSVLSILLLLAGLCPAQNRFMQGVLASGSYRVDVDSVAVFVGGGVHFYVTRGWGADSMEYDTFDFERVQEWPMRLRVFGTVDRAQEFDLNIDPPVEDSWYELPDLAPTIPMVKFRLVTVGTSEAQSAETRVSVGLRVWPIAFGQVGLQARLGREAQSRLEVYDGTGTLVRVLADGVLPAGEHLLVWDGRNSRGQRLATGIYLVRLVAGTDRATAKIVLTD